MTAPWQRRALLAAALGLACLSMLTARVLVTGSRQLRAGEEALRAGRREEAIRSLGRAARMYTPGGGPSARALAQLRELAEQADGRGEHALALLAWREVRSAILATRSFYVPQQALLQQANARIARLLADLEEDDPELRREPLQARLAWHARVLDRDEMPRTGFVLLALMGTALFIGSGFGLALRTLDPTGRIALRPALRCGALALVGFLLMVLGLWRA